MTLELLSLVITAFAVLFSSKKPEGIDLGASFSPSNIFVGGLGSTAGIALAFAFASYIGFEATAIYGEESKDPHKTVPRATYLAVIAITVIFGFTAFGIVTGLGASQVVDQTAKLSSVGDVPLVNPANVLFSVADTYVGSWMSRPDELAGHLVAVRRPAGVPELRGALLLRDGPGRRAAALSWTGSTAAAPPGPPPWPPRSSRSS